MSIVPLVVPDDDTLTIESPDWAIPCGYPEHEYAGDGPATLAVWYMVHRPCGCAGPSFRYFCDGCWTYRNSMGAVSCQFCSGEWPASLGILRVERI